MEALQLIYRNLVREIEFEWSSVNIEETLILLAHTYSVWNSLDEMYVTLGIVEGELEYAPEWSQRIIRGMQEIINNNSGDKNEI